MENESAYLELSVEFVLFACLQKFVTLSLGLECLDTVRIH